MRSSFEFHIKQKIKKVGLTDEFLKSEIQKTFSDVEEEEVDKFLAQIKKKREEEGESNDVLSITKQKPPPKRKN